VVAAMVSAAFVEKDAEKLLDIGVGVVPGDSLIAQVHRDVRAWTARRSCAPHAAGVMVCG